MIPDTPLPDPDAVFHPCEVCGKEGTGQTLDAVWLCADHAPSEEDLEGAATPAPEEGGQGTGEVPGIKAKHAIITPACSAGKGDRRAFTEAVEMLRKEYEDTLRWRAENDEEPANFHLILTVEPVG